VCKLNFNGVNNMLASDRQDAKIAKAQDWGRKIGIEDTVMILDLLSFVLGDLGVLAVDMFCFN
jgi:hypothetical protein